jgi:hypothetical protein
VTDTHAPEVPSQTGPVEDWAPSFVTGTSAEYLGRRPLPRVVRERAAVVVVGPPRSGKTSVGVRLAGDGALVLDTRQLEEAVVDRIRSGVWRAEIAAAAALLLDGPVWLADRSGVVAVLVELLQLRQAAQRRTVVCQSDVDGSVSALLVAMPPGSIAMVGLRFPIGPRGRLRFARALCDTLGLPRARARGTEVLEPWDYPAVLAAVQRRRSVGAP